MGDLTCSEKLQLSPNYRFSLIGCNFKVTFLQYGLPIVTACYFPYRSSSVMVDFFKEKLKMLQFSPKVVCLSSNDQAHCILSAPMTRSNASSERFIHYHPAKFYFLG